MSFLDSWTVLDTPGDRDVSGAEIKLDNEFNPYELENPSESKIGSMGIGSLTDVVTPRENQVKNVPPFWTDFLTRCICLHIMVLLIHVAMLVIWAYQIERRLLIPISLSDVVSSSLNSFLQTLIILISNWLLAVIQPLTLHRQLTERQTLTSLADKCSAWGGLGPAVTALCENFKVPAARMYTLAVSVYFAAMAILQITTPVLFSTAVVTVTLNGTELVDTVVGTPLLYDETALAGWSQNGYSLAGTNPEWLPASAAVNLLRVNTSVTLPGLFKNRVYDTLVTTSSTNGTALVNYTDFQVECGMVPGATVPATVPVISRSDADGNIRNSAVISISTTNNGTNFTIYDEISNLDGANTVDSFWDPAEIRIRIPDTQENIQKGYEILSRNLLLYYVFEDDSGWIRDSSGNGGSSFTIQVTNGSDYTRLVHVQVIGCSMTSSSGTALIDAVTNKLMPEDQPLNRSTDVLWQNWGAKSTSGNQLEDSWSSMFVPGSSMGLWNPGYSTSYSSDWDCATATKRNGSCHVPTVIENYATDQVFGSTARGGSGPYRPFERNATLAKLQTALSEATAMMMWSAARSGPFTSNLRLQSLTNETVSITSSFIGYPRQGRTMVTEYPLTGQLQLSFNSVILGGISSLLMFVIVVAILLPKRPKERQGILYTSKSKALQSIGLLEMCRLMDISLKSELDSFHPSDRKALRRAGMFEVAVVDNRLSAVGPEEKNQLIRDA